MQQFPDETAIFGYTHLVPRIGVHGLGHLANTWALGPLGVGTIIDIAPTAPDAKPSEL